MSLRACASSRYRLRRSLASKADPLLDRANRVEVLVELAAVVLAHPFAKRLGVVRDQIEHAPIVVAAGG